MPKLSFLIFSLLLVILSQAQEGVPPPLRIRATYQVMEDPESDFSDEENYVTMTLDYYPNPNETLYSISALFKEAIITIENTDPTDTIQYVAILSAGSIYDADDDSATKSSSELPSKLGIFAEDEEVPDLSGVLAPGEVKTVRLIYDECAEESQIGAVLTFETLNKNTNKLYDPVDVLFELQCMVAGCSDDCEADGHGVCVPTVGYCRCKDDWLGVSCNYRLNYTEVACPGEQIEMHISFARYFCEGYFSIYTADFDQQSVAYMDFPRDADSCILYQPWPLDGSMAHMSLSAYLKPGPYTIEITNKYGEDIVAAVDLFIDSWSDCNMNYNCSAAPAESVCSGVGACNNETDTCNCSATRFWNDCSGGCDDLTILKELSGVVDSDAGAAIIGRKRMYLNYAVCVWIISPPNVDIINIEFETFDMSGGSDYVTIRDVAKDGTVNMESTPLYRFTGKRFPKSIELERKRIAIVLEADYSISSDGFRLRYTSRNAPLEAKYIVAISLCSFVVIAGLIFLIVFLIIRAKNKREEELAEAMKAESIPWDMTDEEEQVEIAAKEKIEAARSKTNDFHAQDNSEEDFDSDVSDEDEHATREILDESQGPKDNAEANVVIPATNVDGYNITGLDATAIYSVADCKESDEELGWLDLGCLGIECDQHWLRFGLEEGASCPVMEDLKTKLTLTNSSDVPISFCFFHPVNEEKYALTLCPGRGTIPAFTSISVVVNFRLFYTTYVFEHIKLCIYNARSVQGDFEGFDPYVDEDEEELKAPLASARLGISLEGAVSERIDPAEITLRPGTLGVGAFGTVYTGKYRQRIVAVKVMTRQADMLEQIKEEFEKEIELYRKLRNPLLVDFIGASLIPGKLCVATELIRHGSLEHMISAAPVPFVLQARFAHNIAEAVAYLHSNNVLYRDLKPSNVMIVSFSLNAKINCKIGDFGTARNVTDAEEFYLYTAGQGTPIYMAPEVLANREYNSRADVYSYAVTLWQMISRQRPWDNVPVWEFPQRVINGARPPLPEQSVLDEIGVPDEYIRIIKSCWDADARKRPLFSNIVSLLGPICKTAKQKFKESGQHINPKLYPVVGESGSLLNSGEDGETTTNVRQRRAGSVAPGEDGQDGTDDTSESASGQRGIKRMPSDLRSTKTSGVEDGTGTVSSGPRDETGERTPVRKLNYGFTMTLADAMSSSAKNSRDDTNSGANVSRGRSSRKTSTLSGKK